MTDDPYEVLGIERGSGDMEIRRRYLDLVRQYPPERQPERFVVIRKAYDQLRDPVARLESALFDLETADSLDAITADARRRLCAARIPTETLLSLAQQR